VGGPSGQPTFTLRVYRYDPQADAAPRWESFTVPLLPQTTVLDAVFHVQTELDETLAFRCSCRVGMCGSCGMTIDGRPALACQTPVAPAGRPAPAEVTVAPMRHMPVVKDLVVDMAPFFEAYERVIPYLVPKDPEAPPMEVPAGTPFRERIDAQLECITCGLCYSGCGMVGAGHGYLGPAALNRAYTLIADPRDAKGPERMRIVDDAAGVWLCRTQMTCTDHCPKHISPTRAIQRLKGMAVKERVGRALRWWSEDE
jgi:succinate dehydrogenase / fumarate reductase iron-sulfur subunit